MSKKKRRDGNPARSLLVWVFGSMLVPILLAALWAANYQVTSVSAQDAQAIDRAAKTRTAVEKTKLELDSARTRYELERAKLEAKHARAPTAQEPTHPVGPSAADAPGQPTPHPTTKRTHRQEFIEYLIPEVDPKTGKQVLRKHQVRRWVPAKLQNHAELSAPPFHNPDVMRLAGQLREMNEEDPQRAAKLDELRVRLNLEFSQMHENQSREIERTGQRLESLKELHQRRGENRDKIVQQRIDELLGKADDLRWNPVAPGPPSGDRAAGSLSVLQPGSMLRGPIGTSGPPHLPGTTQRNVLMFAGPGPAASTGMLAPPDPPSAPDRATQYDHPSGPATQQKRTLSHERKRVFDSSQQAPTRSSPPADELAGGTGSGASNSMIRRVFQLARSFGAAGITLYDTRKTLERYRALHAQGAMPRADVRKLESEIEQLQQQVDLDKIEFDALGESLRREMELAKQMQQQASDKCEILKSRVDSGTAESEQLVDAEMDLAKAKKTYEDAKASVGQLQQAIELVERSFLKHVDDSAGEKQTP